MQVEYKRDLNCNYMIIHGEAELDTGMYQIRMLTANVISCLLSCHIQSVNDLPLFYFDITSKHSLASMYDQKKLEENDLKMIFSGILHTVDEMSSFLMDPDHLWLRPEGIYIDVEKKKLFFCCLPGHSVDFRKQLRELTEYILPKLDHDDLRTVNLGYKIYRIMLEDYQIDTIKEVLYGKNPELPKQIETVTKNETEHIEVTEEIGSLNGDRQSVCEPQNMQEMQEMQQDYFTDPEMMGNGQKRMIAGMAGSSVLLILLGGCRRAGYLSGLDARTMIGLMILIGLGGILCSFLWAKKGGKKSVKIPLLKDQGVSEEAFTKPEEKTVSLEEKADPPFPHTSDMENLMKKEVIWIGNTERLADNPKKGIGTLVSNMAGVIPVIDLDKNILILGKLSAAVDIVIDSSSVSRIHAKIKRWEGDYYLSDLNSRNGTFVNGEILQEGEERKLSDQDQITFGGIDYIFSI